MPRSPYSKGTTVHSIMEHYSQSCTTFDRPRKGSSFMSWRLTIGLHSDATITDLTSNVRKSGLPMHIQSLYRKLILRVNKDISWAQPMKDDGASSGRSDNWVCFEDYLPKLLHLKYCIVINEGICTGGRHHHDAKSERAALYAKFLLP